LKASAIWCFRLQESSIRVYDGLNFVDLLVYTVRVSRKLVSLIRKIRSHNFRFLFYVPLPRWYTYLVLPKYYVCYILICVQLRFSGIPPPPRTFSVYWIHLTL
jgi:hypothetical protein